MPEAKGSSGKPHIGESKILRHAGRVEQYFSARARVGVMTYVVVSARYESTGGGSLQKAVLYPALETAIRNHAALAARMVARPPSPPTWVRLPSVDLNKVVSFSDKDDQEVHTVLEEFFLSPIDFSEELPMWKLLVLRDGTVVFAFDHTMGDGQSGLAFHHALLKALNSTEPPSESAEHSGIITALPQDTVLAPPIEAVINVSAPFKTVLRMLAYRTFPSLRPKPEPGAWTANPVPNTITMDLTVRIFHLSPEDTAKLTKLSREHKTTLTGTLHTLTVLVLTRLIRTQPSGERFTSMQTNIPISLRRFTGTPPTVICNYVSTHNNHFPLIDQDAPISPDTFPWDNAAALTETLRRVAPNSARVLGMLKYAFGQYEKRIRREIGGQRAGALELSNLGAFPAVDVQDAGSWRIREMVFAQADATVGPAFKLNTVGAPDGGLGVSITWGKGSVDQELAEEYVREFEKGLRALISS
ncbi:alcohol acetyltransferase [Earliella scabrosa]|nr:alcohol acetyltransferase [Earliella scabrosa]